jgi:GH24 family phage-related lysozyme (muramidase)
MKISQTQADRYLRQDLVSHVSGISKYIKVPLTQNQFDALASFHYNLGANVLKGSTLARLINSRQWSAAASQIKKYNRGGGRVLAGLVRRRSEEARIFLSGAPKAKTWPHSQSPK